MSYTPEQQAAMQIYQEFEKALLPAKLVGVRSQVEDAQTKAFENVTHLENALRARKLPRSAENLRAVTNAILFEGKLHWVVEPAKLRIQKEMDGKINQSAVQPQSEFEKKVRAGEKADAKKKADAEAEQAIVELINAYTPRDRMGRVRMSTQESGQKKLRELFLGKTNKQEALKIAQTTVKSWYEAEEKANERMP